MLPSFWYTTQCRRVGLKNSVHCKVTRQSEFFGYLPGIKLQIRGSQQITEAWRVVTGWLQVCVLNTRDEREVQGKPEQNWEHMWSMVTSSTFQVQDGITVLPPPPSLFLYCVYKGWKKNARIHTYALLELIGTRAASKYCCSCVLFYHLIKMHRERETVRECVFAGTWVQYVSQGCIMLCITHYFIPHHMWLKDCCSFYIYIYFFKSHPH